MNGEYKYELQKKLSGINHIGNTTGFKASFKTKAYETGTVLSTTF